MRRTIRENYRPSRRSFYEDEDYSPERRSTRNLYEGKLTKNRLKDINYYVDMDNYELGLAQSDREFNKQFSEMIQDLAHGIVIRTGNDEDINSEKEIFDFVVHLVGPGSKKHKKAVARGYATGYSNITMLREGNIYEDYRSGRRSRNLRENKRSRDLYEDITYHGRDWKKSLKAEPGLKKRVKNIPRGLNKEFEIAFETCNKKLYEMVTFSKKNKVNSDMAWEVVEKSKWRTWLDYYEVDADEPLGDLLALCLDNYWFYFHGDLYA